MRQMREKIKAILERQPGLKAKAIADQLRLDKTEVNQVLYANKNLFVRDEAFAWSLSLSLIHI